jgi:hypothetical protein
MHLIEPQTVCARCRAHHDRGDHCFADKLGRPSLCSQHGASTGLMCQLSETLSNSTLHSTAYHPAPLP